MWTKTKYGTATNVNGWKEKDTLVFSDQWLTIISLV